MTKSLGWNTLLSLPEEDLRTHYPTGASSTSRGRWIPSDDPEKTLGELLKEKAKRLQKERYPVQAGPQRLRWSKKQNRWVTKPFTENEEHGYTENPSRALDRTLGGGVPAEVQEQQSKEANAAWDYYVKVTRPAEGQQQKRLRLVKKLRKLEREASKKGVDITETLEDAVKQSRDQIAADRERAA